MKNTSDIIICPQITFSFITVIKTVVFIYYVNHAKDYYTELMCDPFFSFIFTLIIIISIQNKMYSFYKCVLIICLIISVLKSIAVIIILIIVLFFPDSSLYKQIVDLGVDYNIHNFRIYFMIGLILYLLFVLLEGCVLIGYSKRVKIRCENHNNNIESNMSNQPLINVGN